MQEFLNSISKRVKELGPVGEVATYIPALSQQDPDKFGIAVVTNKGESFYAGDAHEAFSIQSISKVVLLALVLKKYGDDLWERIGLNPSGLPFNSISQLEADKGKPKNPFINDGAIVMVDLLTDAYKQPASHFIDTMKNLSGNNALHFDDAVMQSEWEHRSKNASAAYLMKSFGNIKNEVDQVLKTYFSCCSLAMSCMDLATAFSFLSNKGYSQSAQESFVDYDMARKINSLLTTAGMYDAAGEFAYNIGLPAKSGVGGGVVAVAPGEFSVCAWSPRLDKNGNSVAAQYALKLLCDEIDKDLHF